MLKHLRHRLAECIQKQDPHICCLQETHFRTEVTLNNTFVNNQQVAKEIKREIKNFLETNDNENTTTQNLWDEQKQF